MGLGIKEAQRAALEVFKVVNSICKREGFTYFLAYGTLIGAIRHHGFIPWDDDLDILMPRPDYDAFLAYFKCHAGELEPLVALYNSSQRKLPFLMARISDTTYQQVGEAALDVPEMGAFIDVYPLDGLGQSIDEAVAEKRRCFDLMMKYLRAGDFAMNNRGNGLPKRLAKRAMARLMKPASFYESEILKHADSQTYEDSRFVSCKCWTITSIVDMVHEKADFGNGLPVFFENVEAIVPTNYDAVLRRQYGDYMRLPPESERVGHHMYSLEFR